MLGKSVELCTSALGDVLGMYPATIYINGESVNKWIVDTGLGKRHVPRNSF